MREVKLGDIAKIITGKLDANAADEGGMYPFFTCSRDILRINKYAYDCECVLLAGNGDLNVKYYKGKFNAYQRTYIIELKEGVEFSTIFIYWFLQLYIDILRKNSVGATIKYIKIGDLTSIKLPLVSLPEQERIVSLLDTQFAKIDALKANAASQLQAAKDLFQSALKQLLTPQEGWDEKTLGEVGEFARGGNFTKSDFVADGIPCVHYGQIHMYFGVSTESPLTYLPNDFTKIKYAQPGDLIIAITSEDDEASCKCTAWLGKEPVAVGGHIAVYHHKLDPTFMSYYFRSPFFQKEKLNYTHGFKVVEIKPSDIAKIHISYPKTIAQQQEIVSRLDEISEKVKALQSNYDQTITLCNDLKQALLKSIFG